MNEIREMMIFDEILFMIKVKGHFRHFLEVYGDSITYRDSIFDSKVSQGLKLTLQSQFEVKKYLNDPLSDPFQF